MSIVNKTKLENVFVITPSVFKDQRGKYIECYNQNDYNSSFGREVTFVQDDFSISRKNVLRGIHGDSTTWKLVSCLGGELYLVVVDCRKSEPTFGLWEGFLLNLNDYKQVLIPPGFGNGHYVLSESATFFYKQSSYYGEFQQFSYRYNEPLFNINWPLLNVEPILSDRDRQASFINSF